MQITNKLKIESSVLNIYKSSDTLLVLDQNGNLHTFQDSYSYMGATRLFERDIELHRHAKATSFSNSDLFFYPKPDSSSGDVFTTKETPPFIQSKITEHSAPIEVSTFSEDAGLFATGAADGRAYIYDADTMRYIIALPPKPDYISNLTFSEVNKYLLSCSFDHTNTLYNIQMAIVQSSFITTDVLEAAIFIRNEKCIYYILRNGASCIYDIQAQRVESENNLFPAWPTTLVAINESPFIIVGTKSNKIYVVNYDTNSIEFSITLSFKEVSALKIYKNFLYIGSCDGDIQVVDLDAYKEQFILATKLKNFSDANKYIEKNIFLQLNSLYTKTLFQNWDQVVVKIIDAIAQNENEKVQELGQPYLQYNECKKLYDAILLNKTYIFALYDAIESRNFAQAYSIVQKLPFLSVATPFMQLEKHWNNTFIKVKENVRKDPIRAQKSAEMLLLPFYKVPSKREMITFLLKSPQLVFESELAVKEKKFGHYFYLCRTHPVLAETSLYEKVIKFGKNVVVQLEIAIKEFDIQKTTELSDFLEDFPMYERDAKKAKIFLSDFKKYENYIDEKDFIKACEMTFINPNLSEHTKYKTIENGFLSAANKAQVYAISGDAREALELLGKFWQIDYFKSKIANIAKLAYVNEMYRYKNVTAVDWPKSISAYLIRYGSDDYLEKKLKEMGLISIYEECKLRVEKKGYKNFKLSGSLLVKKE